MAVILSEFVNIYGDLRLIDNDHNNNLNTSINIRKKTKGLGKRILSAKTIRHQPCNPRHWWNRKLS